MRKVNAPKLETLAKTSFSLSARLRVCLLSRRDPDLPFSIDAAGCQDAGTQGWGVSVKWPQHVGDSPKSELLSDNWLLLSCQLQLCDYRELFPSWAPIFSSAVATV